MLETDNSIILSTEIYEAQCVLIVFIEIDRTVLQLLETSSLSDPGKYQRKLPVWETAYDKI